MPNILRVAFPILAALCLQAPLHAQALPSPQDFSASWEIQTQGDSNLYEIELPFAVYQAAHDPQLRDLGVFDGNGEPVPRILRTPKGPANRSTIRTAALKLFPVLSSGQQQLQAGKLVFQQSGDETVLTYDGAESGAGTTAERLVTAYVVDVSGLKHRLHQLTLEWPDSTSPFIVGVHVEGSDDLAGWSSLGRGSLAELKQDDARIVRSSISLNRRKVRYLRITWSDAPDDWQLAAASGRYYENTRTQAVAKTQMTRLVPHARDTEDNGYLFDLGGAPEVTQLQLALPADNTVIRAAVFAKVETSTRWRRVGKQLFYNLTRGQAQIENDPLTLSGMRARYWKVIIETGRPELELAMQIRWQPDRLQFIAQGEPPYELVAGRPEARKEQYPMQAKFGDAGIFQISRVTGRAVPAVLGSQTVYREADEHGEALAFAWRKWTLWLVLIAGVLAVATMAVRLLRQLDS